MQLTALATLTFVDVPDERKSAATTISAIAHQLSMSVGIAVAALTLNLAAALRGGGAGWLAAADFRVALVALAAMAALSLLRFVALDRSAGAEVSGHRAPSAKEPGR
jgi:hypothetical protein